MTILFGQFLIDKGILPKEQVLEALIYQIGSRWSLAQLIFENQLLTCEEQLKVLSYLRYGESDYQNSAEVLGIWNQELANQVKSIEKNRGRPPLGEVLIKLGFFDIREMTQALEIFLQYQDSIRSSEIDRSTKNPSQQTGATITEATKIVEFIENRMLPGLQSAQVKLESSTCRRSVIDEVSSSLLAEIKTLRVMSDMHRIQKLLDLSEHIIELLEGFLHDEWKWEKYSKFSVVLKLIKFLYQYLQIVSYYLNECTLESFDDADKNLNDLELRLQDTIGLYAMKRTVK